MESAFAVMSRSRLPSTRIVFEEVRQRLGVGDVVNRHEVDPVVVQRGAHDVAADASEAVDPNLDGHA